MPELPEVETIRRGLEKYLVGHTIRDVEIRLHKVVSGETKNIIGSKIKKVIRFGKGLVIELSNDYVIAIHIKLTGQLIYQGPDAPAEVSKEKVGTLPNKFTHVIFHLDKKGLLYYNDMRQFGWIKILPLSDLTKLPFFKDLGPDILSNVTIEKFSNILKKAKTAVKILLLDQKKFSGIGNIYANDALWLAKISPKRSASSLSDKEIKLLYDSILHVLQKGLSEGGASELTFVNAVGKMGNYQNHMLVYGKNGQKCARCGTIITKYMLGSRGTYVCQHCQK